MRAASRNLFTLEVGSGNWLGSCPISGEENLHFPSEIMYSNMLGALLLSAAVFLQCGSVDTNEAQTALSTGEVAGTNEVPAYAPKSLKDPVPVPKDEVDRLFADAARAAWAQVDANYHRATGLVNAQPTWAYPTAWDIASALASYYSARGLGLITEEDYQQRASRLLATMQKARLYQARARRDSESRPRALARPVARRASALHA